MHSDIKSRNVLLSGNHEVAKISDVGFAKFLHEGASATQENYVAWTFAYAAPEVLMNQSSGAEVSFETVSATAQHLHWIQQCLKASEPRRMPPPA